MSEPDTTPSTEASAPRSRRTNLAWLAAYLAAMAGLVGLVLYAREVTLREMDTPDAHADWQAWREAQPNTDTSGPVRRQPPKADEPPALLLMRDHFAVVMSGAVLFGSLLFAAIMMAARGAFAASPQLQRPAQSRKRSRA